MNSKITFSQLMDKVDPEILAKIDATYAKLKDQPTTADPVDKGGNKQADGTYTPERQALHQKLIQDILNPKAVVAATPKPGEQPVANLIGGRAGSGKSYVTGPQGPVDLHTSLYLNSDDIKAMLPEYEGWNAALVHEEAGDIFDQVNTMATQLGLNVTEDATMRSKSSLTDRINTYKAAGYKVNGYMVVTPPEISTLRVIGRFNRAGRFVPPTYSFNSRTNEANFDSNRDAFSKWGIFDNSGSETKLISQGEN